MIVPVFRVVLRTVLSVRESVLVPFLARSLFLTFLATDPRPKSYTMTAGPKGSGGRVSDLVDPRVVKGLDSRVPRW